MGKTLFDSIKKSYRINCRCSNCGEFSEISVPKGVTIEGFMKSEKSVCPSCGCNTLEKYTFPKPTKPAEEKTVPTRLIFGPKQPRKKYDHIIK